jgi:hypothetical protein
VRYIGTRREAEMLNIYLEFVAGENNEIEKGIEL